jgi:hypothetical protein
LIIPLNISGIESKDATITEVDNMANDVYFIAIGVEQGDAFFIKKGEKKLLVDGGRSHATFPKKFLTVTRINGVNVLVCTHSDSDHAGGVLAFLQDKRLSAEEVWLPASWMTCLIDILHRPYDFLEELASSIEKLGDRPIGTLSSLGDDYSAKETANGDDYLEIYEKDILKSVREEDFERSFYHSFLSLQFFSMIRQEDKRRLLLEAILASDLIRKIVLAAYRRGISVKWFDYIGKNAQKPSGGVQDFLVPVNSVEVVKIQSAKRSALERIALTMSNKQSLVFSSPMDDYSSGVLFTADSDLRFNQSVPWTDQMIITSPHHGSESNKDAYVRFQQETGGRMNVVWVRSDKRSSGRPGNSYLRTRGRKYCTSCRNYPAPKQNVKMSFSQGKHIWTPIRTRKCHC